MTEQPQNPPTDIAAILADQQEQIDELTAAMKAQQETLDQLVRERQR